MGIIFNPQPFCLDAIIVSSDNCFLGHGVIVFLVTLHFTCMHFLACNGSVIANMVFTSFRLANMVCMISALL